MIAPTFGSCAEIVATLAISLRSSTSRALLSRLSETAVAANVPGEYKAGTVGRVLVDTKKGAGTTVLGVPAPP